MYCSYMGHGETNMLKQIFKANDGFKENNYGYFGLPDRFMTPRSSPPAVQFFCPLRNVSQLSI